MKNRRKKKESDQMKSLWVKLGVILIGLAIFGCAEMRGAHWKIFSSTDLYECFYYAENMTRSYKNIVRVWIKLEYTEKGIAENVKEFGKNYENLSYSLQLWEIDCPAKKRRILSINQYSVEGNILNTKPAKSRLSESLGKSLSETVCK
jgi:hypothetical protein